jgi:hypothetical protein
MILSNKRSLETGELTNPVVLSYSFMNALFNIEQNYSNDEVFVLRKRMGLKREYRLNHITPADIQLAIILQKCCYTNGQLVDLKTYSNVYHKIDEYFESPVCPSQFYAAVEKFKLHQLITVQENHSTGLFSIILNHYLDEETGKIGYYVKAHPFVFTTKFNSMTIGEQKLFLSLYIQQAGNSEHKPTFRMFQSTLSQDIQLQSLQTFLHGNTAHIRQLIDRLSKDDIFYGMPIFKKVSYEKKGRSFLKVYISLNSSLFEVTQDIEYHDPIPALLVYKRKASYLSRLLEDWCIGEIEVANEGREFAKIVRIFRNASSSVIRHVIHKLRDKLVTRVQLPHNAVRFIESEMRNSWKTKMIAITEEFGLTGLITAGLTEEEQEEREFMFASMLSHYSERTVRSLFKNHAQDIQNKYMTPAQIKDTKYNYDARLDGVNGIMVARAQAIRLHKDPTTYRQLEIQVAENYTFSNKSEFDERKQRQLIEKLLEAIDKLPKVRLRPNAPPDFRLEEHLIALLNLNMAS